MSVKFSDFAALVLRVGFGLNMLIGHGLSKFQTLISGDEINFPSVLGFSPSVALGLAVFGEFIACIFIVLGLKTRLASVPIILTMAIAAFVIHGPDPWFSMGAESGSKEMAILYLLGFLVIYMMDSGKYSLDHRLDNGL